MSLSTRLRPDWKSVDFEGLDVLVLGPLGIQHCDWTPHMRMLFPFQPTFNCEACSLASVRELVVRPASA